MRARVRVEIEYLVALADLDDTELELNDTDRAELRGLYEDFGERDAKLVKKIETEGNEQFEATNHDVKAVEYFIRSEVPDKLQFVVPWIHLGLTSEDINNIAYRLLTRDACVDVLLPEIKIIQERLSELAIEFRDFPMLGHTHGQPATPTTFGKEMAVYVSRLERSTNRIEEALNGIEGKLNGATGTYSAHVQAYPSVDWREFSRKFVEDFGFDHVDATTQINPCDDLAELLDALRGVNNILLDLSVDNWLYISDEYLGQEPAPGEVGSSTMPHKLNPIDFEIAEGNLSKANSDLKHITDEITNSRYQRDISDSTAKRHIATAMA
jgi:adenylosuccinate lyase